MCNAIHMTLFIARNHEINHEIRGGRKIVVTFSCMELADLSSRPI